MGRDLDVLETGEHFVTWDGRDSRGGKVGAGVYFIQVRWVDGASTPVRVVLLR